MFWQYYTFNANSLVFLLIIIIFAYGMLRKLWNLRVNYMPAKFQNFPFVGLKLYLIRNLIKCLTLSNFRLVISPNKSSSQSVNGSNAN